MKLPYMMKMAASKLHLLTLSANNLRSQRCLSASPSCWKKTRPSLPNLATPEEATKKTEIKRKLFKRMFDFIGSYSDKVLANVLPKVAYAAIQLFSKGTQALLSDMKEYRKINSVLLSGDWQKSCQSLSRKQLEVHAAFVFQHFA